MLLHRNKYSYFKMYEKSVFVLDARVVTPWSMQNANKTVLLYFNLTKYWS